MCTILSPGHTTQTDEDTGHNNGVINEKVQLSKDSDCKEHGSWALKLHEGFFFLSVSWFDFCQERCHRGRKGGVLCDCGSESPVAVHVQT